jgi:hypothetical protein
MTKALCGEKRIKNYKVVNPNDLLGLTHHMEEDEVRRIVGSDPVHLTGEGYATLADSIVTMVESKRGVYEGGKRGYEEADEGVEYPILNCRNEEWVYNMVYGTGKWRGGKASGVRGRGSGAVRGSRGGYNSYDSTRAMIPFGRGARRYKRQKVKLVHLSPKCVPPIL